MGLEHSPITNQGGPLMRSLILFFALTVSVFGQAFPGTAAYQAAFLKPAAGGGAAQWYQSVASGDTDTTQNLNDSANFWAGVVTVGQSGNATKLRVYVINADFNPECKIALYDASSNLLASVTSTLTDALTPYEKEVTISPTAVTSGSVYLVAIGANAGATDVQFRYQAGTGTRYLDITSYASQPSSPYEAAGAASGAISVGIYIEP
jgi:hypothetical protein